ncbi:MAG: universal stress protein [Bradyrhizobium sp.]|uniref:universal stress protein n=1 Tax=Bradyrhizobium sp. TaxID=376 RepID=UPI001225A8AD|nr:universal stress protein [Bradyrhizobium sp.]THD70464.1 MAG: universal stress protein [Bradyrhizobium sp.]
MSYATLMVYLNADHVSKQLIGVAVGLADKFSARLIGVSALGIMPPVAAEGVVIVDNASEFDIAQMKAKLADAENRFRTAAGARLQIEWRAAIELPTDTLIRESRCADLILLERSRPSEDMYRVANAGAAILRAGRPILVVPAAVKSLQAEHVVIGWKDTREARRAVADALPFLHEAKRVTVIEICERDQMQAARLRLDDVVHYLACHRIKAEGRTETQMLSSAAQIIEFAQNENADLLVTGAYGHSRLNEWIFGGMTRDLMTSSPICWLMSH